MLDSFDVIRKPGQGGYSNVFLVKNKKKIRDVCKNQLVAVKVISKKHQRSILREIQVSLRRLRWLRSLL